MAVGSWALKGTRDDPQVNNCGVGGFEIKA